MNEHFFIYNGQLLAENTPIISAGHPALLYGEGIFESMRWCKGRLLNADLHFQRMIHGLEVLQLDFTHNFKDVLIEDVSRLSAMYADEDHLRIRLSLLRSGNSFQHRSSALDYIIQAVPISHPVFDGSGLEAVIFPASKKGTGELANLKSANFMLYTAAQRFASGKGKREAIVLNSYGRVCETSIANVFFTEADQIFTPSLAEGCVAGTIRQWILNHADHFGLPIQETICTTDRLLNAREVFITNAIKWVVPVRQIEGTTFGTGYAEKIFRLLKAEFLKEINTG